MTGKGSKLSKRKGKVKAGADLGGRVQGVRTPPPPRDALRFSYTTGILPKKNYVVYWC